MSQEVNLDFKGEMLFGGANSLQMAADVSLDDLAQKANTNVPNIKGIGVKSASITVNENQLDLVESLLLQVVSNNQNLISVGTLSPVDKAGNLELSIAQELDLLPYLQDEGCTWVLDVNLNTEDMLDLELAGNLTMLLEYTEK